MVDARGAATSPASRVGFPAISVVTGHDGCVTADGTSTQEPTEGLAVHTGPHRRDNASTFLGSLAMALLVVVLLVALLRSCVTNLGAHKLPCAQSELALNRDAGANRVASATKRLSGGASPTKADRNGDTPIKCGFGNPEMMTLLLDHHSGFEPISNPATLALEYERHPPIFNFGHPLHFDDAHVELLGIVLDHGANPDDDSTSPLTELASSSGECSGAGRRLAAPALEAATMLLDHGADPTAPLAHAVSAGYDDLFDLLLRRGADPNSGTPAALVRAAFCDRRQMLGDLLRAKADPNRLSDVSLITVLGLAGGTSNPSDPVQATLLDLVKAGQAPTVSPLASAVFGRHVEVVQELLFAGANVSLGYGPVQPLAIAVLLDDGPTCAILLARGADPNAPNGPLPSALTLATQYNRQSALAALNGH